MRLFRLFAEFAPDSMLEGFVELADTVKGVVEWD